MIFDSSNPINWSHSLASGLAAWWKVVPQFWGGNVLRDLVGENHGTLTNMDAASDWLGMHGPGGFGSIDLDGTNDFIDCGTAFNWDRTQPWTMIASFRRDAIGANHDFFANFVATTYRGWGMLWASNNKFQVHIINTWGSNNRIEVDSTSADTSLDWVRVGATYDGSSAVSGIKIYKNGDAVASTALSHTLSATSAGGGNNGIGSRDVKSVAEFNGKISEVVLYDRALGAGEITALDLAMTADHNPMIAWIDPRKISAAQI